AQDEVGFLDSQHPLDVLMDSAKTSLQWIDWQVLREAAQRQAKVEQKGKVFGDIQCLKDIGDVEAQLIAWGVISVTKTPFLHNLCHLEKAPKNELESIS